MFDFDNIGFTNTVDTKKVIVFLFCPQTIQSKELMIL